MIIDIATAVFMFVLIWWTVIFAVLPWGNAPSDNPIVGQDRSAPANPRIKQKLIWTTLLSLLITGIIVVLMHYTGFSFYREVKAWS